jgi:hypothetical protein
VLFLSIPPAKAKQGQHSIRGSNSRVENSVRHVPQQRTRQSPLVKLCPNQDDGSFFFLREDDGSFRCVRFVFFNESNHDHMLPELQAKAAQPRLHLQVQAERQSWRGATRAHTTAAAGTRKIQKAAEHVVRQCVHATSKEKKRQLYFLSFFHQRNTNT